MNSNPGFNQPTYPDDRSDNISGYPMNSPIHGAGQSPPMHNRAKQILASTQSAFEKLKKDLADKEYTIETKNREILQLRMAVEEAKQFQLHNKRAV